MSEFDFDEIDKAVAGALSPDDSPNTSEGAVDDTSEETPASTSTSEEPTSPSRETTPEPAVSRPAPAVRRSAGRFMDVVHPSSDMRAQTGSQNTVNRPSQVISRTGLTIPSPSEIPSEKPAVDSEEAQPLESPFLPDAKVEKRPLGAFADAAGQAEPEPKEPEEELLLEAPDEPRLEPHVLPDPIDFAAHASALSSENEDTGVLQTPQEESELVAEEKLAEVEAEVDTKAETTAVEEPEKAPEAETQEELKQPESEPTGPASISQQYTEQPSSAPSSGAIYDTETYHQPLAPAPKKRSGAWTFIWIILLVILGAAAGFAFYKFVLPMLGA